MQSVAKSNSKKDMLGTGFEAKPGQFPQSAPLQLSAAIGEDPEDTAM
jgi:hypothetical protein